MADKYGTMAPNVKQLQLRVDVFCSIKHLIFGPAAVCFLLFILVPDYLSFFDHFPRPFCHVSLAPIESLVRVVGSEQAYF